MYKPPSLYFKIPLLYLFIFKPIVSALINTTQTFCDLLFFLCRLDMNERNLSIMLIL